MRILIHDFAGHPFQVQLSRELARMGHDVTHAYPLGLQGPKGRLERSPSDPDRLDIRAIPLNGGFRKYSPSRRLAAQRQYARDLKRILDSQRFDVVLSGNTPIDVQAELLWYCLRKDIAFVHWVQDVYCRALDFFLRKKLGRFAAPLSYPFVLLERFVARFAHANIVIASAFADLLTKWSVASDRITVLENWAPLDEIPRLPRANEWCRSRNLTSSTNFIYSGTLGIKHRPDLLYRLALSLDNSCMVTVITEGPGREYLERQPKLDNLQLLDYQSYDQVPQVLATADVLLATLESDAGEFAVPSKILSYLSAGRPLLLAAPRKNLAASVVERSAAGIVVDPESPGEWIAAAKRLASDPALRSSLGANARRYAEREFDIRNIAAKFETVLIDACEMAGNVVAPILPVPAGTADHAVETIAMPAGSGTRS